MKDSEENISLQEDKDLGIETDLETTLEIVLDDSPDRDRRNAKRVNRSRNKSRNNFRDRSNDRAARNGRNDSRQNQVGIDNIVIKMVTLGNTVWRCKPMPRKPEGLRRWMIEMMTHQTPSTPW